jgi:murein DD-endopeptidase MepM/ murein hydrolase activator NlpD
MLHHTRISRRIALGAVALLALAARGTVAVGGAAAAEPAPLAIEPGGLVRWGGEGTESCSMDGASWQPIAGVCWYPIDLLHDEGTVTVGRRVGGELRTAAVRVGDYPYSEERLTVDDRHVNLSAADQARADREAERIGALWDLRTPRRFSLPLTKPLARLPEGGRFGSRRVFNGVPKNPHTGSDYAAPTGTAVLAPADGTVALAGDFFFSGGSVFLDHGDGLITMMFHLSEVDVEQGQQVTAGQRIGEVGATGRATGPHLHFGVRWRGARIDPALLFEPPAEVPSIGG